MADIYWVAELNTAHVAIVPRPRGGDWLSDDLASIRAAGVDLLVSLLTSWEEMELGLTEESALAKTVGLEFVAMPVPDRGVPASTPATYAVLQQLGAAAAEGKTIAAHCRQSIWRASLLVASLLVRGGMPADEAWQRVEHARGQPVPETDAQRLWVSELAHELPNHII
jgi:protein-tyrosine phosphatase